MDSCRQLCILPPAFPPELCCFSLRLLLRAETSTCRASTTRSLSTTSLHAFCPQTHTDQGNRNTEFLYTYHEILWEKIPSFRANSFNYFFSSKLQSKTVYQ
ncbi:hypothetical protein XENORESO_005275 [Xenotaenia resolanae]|uniref:Uncharacterized protein n=1 Tax=Xenotaenia resolanae TaxID=208358 RepID=A0ABV0WJ33_9TELE